MYENFYKLKTSPFRLSPDPNFFFGSKGHNRALAYLRYGLQQKEGFIVITGTPGTGKTTLSRALLQEIGREKIIVAELNTTHLEADDVLRMVAGSFGLEFEGAPKATLLKRLESYFISRYRAGYHILLIIDEAQNLPFGSVEELRMLSNFYMGKHALIQIFLLGQEQFRKSLYSKDLEQLRQRVVASCHLEPLNQEETREYIEHRLKLVGWNNDPQISDRAFARIFTLTKGIPRRINTFCDRLFLFGSLDDIHQIKDSHVKDVARELMYEVSAKDVKLSDIKAEESEAEKKDSSIDTETLDSEQLGNFSDDIIEEVATVVDETVPLVEEKTPVSESEQATEPQTKKKDVNNSSGNTERQTLRVVTNNHNAVESFESMPMAATDRITSDSKPDWWKLVALAVDYYQNPESHKGLNSSRNILASGITDMLKVGAGKKIIPAHMRTDELSGVSDETLRKSCINYIKNVLLTSKANYYRRLGVNPEASLEHIRTHYRYLFKLLQSEREQEDNEQDEMYIRRINQAFSTLRSVEKRQEYDDFLSSIKNNKQEKDVIYEDLNHAVDIDDTDLSGAIIEEDFAVPSISGEGKNSRVYWLVLVVCLLLSGAGAYYYLQPNLDQIKSKLAIIFPELKSPDTDIAGENSLFQDSVIKSPEQLDQPVIEMDAVPLETLSEVESKVAEPIIEKTEPKIIVKPKPIVKKSEAPPEIEKVVKIEPQTPKKPTPVKIIDEKPKPAKVVDAKPKPKPKPAEKPQEEKIVAPAVVKAEKKLQPVPIPTPVDSKVDSNSKSENSVDTPTQLFSEAELSALVSRFSLTYEEGELDEFMALFSKDALTNNDENWSNIRNDYKSLFESTEMRVIELGKMIWQQANEVATAEGSFVVTVLRRDAENIQKFTGRIKLEVKKVEDSPLIAGMYHAYSDN